MYFFLKEKPKTFNWAHNNWSNIGFWWQGKGDWSAVWNIFGRFCWWHWFRSGAVFWQVSPAAFISLPGVLRIQEWAFLRAASPPSWGPNCFPFLPGDKVVFPLFLVAALGDKGGRLIVTVRLKELWGTGIFKFHFAFRDRFLQVASPEWVVFGVASEKKRQRFPLTVTNSSCPVSSSTKLERGAAPTNQPPLLQIIPSSKILCCSLKKKTAKKNQPRSVLLGKPTGTLLGCPGNSTDAASELHFLDELLIRETSGNKCSFSSVFTRCKVRFWGGKK